jgi:hypothetical protein
VGSRHHDQRVSSHASKTAPHCHLTSRVLYWLKLEHAAGPVKGLTRDLLFATMNSCSVALTQDGDDAD